MANNDLYAGMLMDEYSRYRPGQATSVERHYAGFLRSLRRMTPQERAHCDEMVRLLRARVGLLRDRDPFPEHDELVRAMTSATAGPDVGDSDEEYDEDDDEDDEQEAEWEDEEYRAAGVFMSAYVHGDYYTYLSRWGPHWQSPDDESDRWYGLRRITLLVKSLHQRHPIPEYDRIVTGLLMLAIDSEPRGWSGDSMLEMFLSEVHIASIPAAYAQELLDVTSTYHRSPAGSDSRHEAVEMLDAVHLIDDGLVAAIGRLNTSFWHPNEVLSALFSALRDQTMASHRYERLLMETGVAPPPGTNLWPMGDAVTGKVHEWIRTADLDTVAYALRLVRDAVRWQSLSERVLVDFETAFIQRRWGARWALLQATVHAARHRKERKEEREQKREEPEEGSRHPSEDRAHHPRRRVRAPGQAAEAADLEGDIAVLLGDRRMGSAKSTLRLATTFL